MKTFVASFLFLSFTSLTTTTTTAETCAVPGTLTCYPITDATTAVGREITTPSIDGDLSDWVNVSGGITTGLRSMFGNMYEDGDATFKCLYDTEKVYL
jgi:hypothetical protein